MRNYLFLFVIAVGACITLAWTNDVKPPKRALIEATVYEVIPPCADSPDAQAKRVPLVNKRIYIYNKHVSRKKFSRSEATDSTGKIRFWALVYGCDTFQFFESWKTDKYVLPKNTATETWDKECYRTSYATPDCEVALHQSATVYASIELLRNCDGMNKCCQRITPVAPTEIPKNK